MNHDSFSKMYSLFVLRNKHMVPDWKYFSLDFNKIEIYDFFTKERKEIYTESTMNDNEWHGIVQQFFAWSR